MMRRHAVSIVLAALAVFLAGYLLWFDGARITSGERDLRKRNLLPAFRRGDISELVIESNGETFHVARRNDDAGTFLFYLDGGELADQGAVDKALAALEFATPERRLDASQDRHALGLDAPRLRFTLVMGALTYRIAVGAAAPSPPGAVYAMAEGEGIAGEQLVVLPRDVWTELSRPRDVYRSRTLLPYLSSSLAAITVEGGGERRQLVRGPRGGWAIEIAGQKVRVDRDAMDRLLTAFADLRAEAFAGAIEAQEALAKADDKLHIVLAPSDGAAPRAALEVGGICPGHPEDAVAMRAEPPPKVAACVPKGLIESLSAPAATLADLHLFSLRPDEIEQVELLAGDRRLEVSRAGAAWHMRAPAEAAVDGDVGQAFARALHDIDAEAIATTTAEESGLSAPAARAVLTKAGASAEEREEVQMGREEAGKVFVRRVVDGVILRCDADVAHQLSPNGPSLRSRKVVDLTLGQVHKAVIASADVHQTLSRSSSGGWTLDEPKGMAVDPGLAADVTEALAELRADHWVDVADDGSYGFGAPRAAYELVVEAGTIRVEVGRKTERGSFARRLDSPGVFVLSMSTEQKLETWAVDRSYFMVDPSEVRQIRLEQGTASITLGAARPADPDEASRAAERFETAKRALAEARTEGVVRIGAPVLDEGFDRPRLVVVVVRAGSTGTPSTLRMLIGKGDVFHDTNVFYVRRDGVDATFAMAQGKLRPLLEIAEAAARQLR
jgi:hypothetical protein